jgi:hypothetical protein
MKMMIWGLRACEACRPLVQARIFDDQFPVRLAATVLPFAIVLLLLIAWQRWSLRKER